MPQKKKRILENPYLFKKGKGGGHIRIREANGEENHTHRSDGPIRRSFGRCEAAMSQPNTEHIIVSLSSIEKLINHNKICDCKSILNLNVVGRKFLSNTASLICTKCSRVSKPIKLYEEYKPATTTKKNAYPSSTLNAAFAAALLNTSIGPTQARQLLQSMGICAGSTNGLTKLTHSIGELIKTLAYENLQNERKKLRYKPDIAITVDGIYNNRTTYCKSPYQAATQLTFSILAHDNSHPQSRPKIVDMKLKNKLCPTGHKANIDGKVPPCPNHPGCTANCREDDSIANEGALITETLDLLKSDNVSVQYLCSDGDSSISKQVKKTNQSIQLCKDRHHFARNMRKRIKGIQLSPKCFETKNKKTKQQRQGWFANDITKRTEAEFTKAMKEARRTKKTSEKIKLEAIKLLKDTPLAIIRCHSGQCGESCEINSRVCNGKNGYRKHCTYKGPVNLNQSDEEKLLKVLQARLGHEGVTQTFTALSTQGNEALNRSFVKTCPKNITCSRIFPARAARNALNYNLGFPESTLLILNRLGHPMSEQCYKLMIQDENKQKIINKHHKSKRRKARRHLASIQKYFRYKKSQSVTYQRGIELGLGL